MTVMQVGVIVVFLLTFCLGFACGRWSMIRQYNWLRRELDSLMAEVEQLKKEIGVER